MPQEPLRDVLRLPPARPRPKPALPAARGLPPPEVCLVRLHELGITTLATGEVDGLVLYLLDLAEQATSAAMGTVHLAGGAKTLEVALQHGFGPEHAALCCEGAPLYEVAARTLQARAHSVVANLRFHGDIPEDARRAIGAAGIHAWQMTPLVSRTGHAVGIVSTYFRNAHTPTDRQLQLLSSFARLRRGLPCRRPCTARAAVRPRTRARGARGGRCEEPAA